MSSLETGDDKSLLSIVIPTHDRPKILRMCLESLASQSSKRFEVIVVCNGSGVDTHELVNLYADKLPRMNVVTFPMNIWNWDDYREYYGTVYRSGLNAATGDFILFLSDDDALGSNFVELLFKVMDKERICVAFMGSGIDRDLVTGVETTQVIDAKYRTRPQLEDGLQLALRFFSTKNTDNQDLIDPGFGYVIKTSLYKDPELQELIWSGGYEVTQYLALIPHGQVAFDESAKFYWGRHPDQTNKIINARIGTMRQYEVIRRREKKLAEEIWQKRFGQKNADELSKRLAASGGIGSVKYLWQPHPYDRNVVWDLGRVVRRPQRFKEVFASDGRELIFWLLVPRAAVVLVTRLLTRMPRVSS